MKQSMVRCQEAAAAAPHGFAEGTRVTLELHRPRTDAQSHQLRAARVCRRQGCLGGEDEAPAARLLQVRGPSNQSTTQADEEAAAEMHEGRPAAGKGDEDEEDVDLRDEAAQEAEEIAEMRELRRPEVLDPPPSVLDPTGITAMRELRRLRWTSMPLGAWPDMSRNSDLGRLSYIHC